MPDMTVDLVRTSAFARATDPKVMEVDFEHLALLDKERRAADEKANPPKATPVAEQLRVMRRELFVLRQNKEGAENRANEAAGQVKLAEKRLHDALVLRKQRTNEGNFIGERGAENDIKDKEFDLKQREKEFKGLAHQSKLAHQAVKNFDYDGLKMLEEKVKEIEAARSNPSQEPTVHSQAHPSSLPKG